MTKDRIKSEVLKDLIKSFAESDDVAKTLNYYEEYIRKDERKETLAEVEKFFDEHRNNEFDIIMFYADDWEKLKNET